MDALAEIARLEGENTALRSIVREALSLLSPDQFGDLRRRMERLDAGGAGT